RSRPVLLLHGGTVAAAAQGRAESLGHRRRQVREQAGQPRQRPLGTDAGQVSGGGLTGGWFVARRFAKLRLWTSPSITSPRRPSPTWAMARWASGGPAVACCRVGCTR